MREYTAVILTTLFLAWMITKTRVGPLNSIASRNKDRVCYFVMFLLLALFIGLRTRYNDTYTYVIIYNEAPGFPEVWKSIDLELGANPGFVLVNAWLRSNEVSDRDFILLYTAVSLACLIRFLKRYSNDLTLSMFLFFMTNAYTLSAAAVKQSMALGLGLLAVDFGLQRKWVRFAVFLFLGATFHPYVLLYGLLPLLTFTPWTKKTYIMLSMFICSGFMLESLLGTIVDITSMIGDTYETEELIGEGINIFRVLVANVPLVLTFLYRKQLFRDSTRSEHLMINFAMMNGALMFVGMFGTAIYFSRLASYFTIAQCVVLPWILSKLPRERRTFYTLGMIVGYLGFFVYANMISQSFSANFSRITLGTYLRNYVF